MIRHDTKFKNCTSLLSPSWQDASLALVYNYLPNIQILFMPLFGNFIVYLYCWSNPSNLLLICTRSTKLSFNSLRIAEIINDIRKIVKINYKHRNFICFVNSWKQIVCKLDTICHTFSQLFVFHYINADCPRCLGSRVLFHNYESRFMYGQISVASHTSVARFIIL